MANESTDIYIGGRLRYVRHLVYIRVGERYEGESVKRLDVDVVRYVAPAGIYIHQLFHAPILSPGSQIVIIGQSVEGIERLVPVGLIPAFGNIWCRIVWLQMHEHVLVAGIRGKADVLQQYKPTLVWHVHQIIRLTLGVQRNHLSLRIGHAGQIKDPDIGGELHHPHAVKIG